MKYSLCGFEVFMLKIAHLCVALKLNVDVNMRAGALKNIKTNMLI